MDLSTLDTTGNAGVAMPVLHPATRTPLLAADGSPITISLVSTDSKPYRDALRETTNKQLRENRRAVLTAEQIEDKALSLLAACVTGWSNIELEGAVLPFSAANVKRLFACVPWLKEQCDEFVTERANFLKV